MNASASGNGGRRDDRRAASGESDSEGIGATTISGVFNALVLEEPDPSDSSGSENSWMDDDDEVHWYVPVDVSYLVPLNGDMEHFNRFSIAPLAFEDGRNHVGFYLGGGSVVFKGGSLPDRAVEDGRIFELGLSYRRYLNDPHVFLSPYVAVNAAWQPLFWNYRNAVVSGGDSIDSDSLDGANLYTGLGVAIWRSKMLSLFGEAGIGGTVYWKNTDKGFRNDVFDDFGYLAVKVGLTISF